MKTAPDDDDDDDDDDNELWLFLCRYIRGILKNTIDPFDHLHALCGNMTHASLPAACTNAMHS